MGLIKKYPEGSNITIMNASYHKAKKDEMTGKWSNDFINIVYKDNNTGEKHNQIVYNPDYIYYKLNDGEYVTDFNRFYIPKEKVHPVECKYRDLLKSVATEINQLDFFYENIKTGKFRNNKLLHTNTNVFGTDMDIEDHYRMRFAHDYVNESGPLKLGYMDIETDIKVIGNRFPQMGEVPINAVTYIDDKTNSCNVFLLRDIREDNPLITQFENRFKSTDTRNALFRELKQFTIDKVGGKEKADKYGISEMKFEFFFFDSEVELLYNLFRLINFNSPDFMLAWNMAFDIPYIIERCRVLNIDPANVLSDPNYKEKYANYFIDMRHKNSYEARGDYYDIASNTTYIDQLIQFASRRKGQSAFPNFKLDTAAEIITDGAVRKLDYSDIVSNLGDLPYVDYKTFVFYNIMDVIAQRCIETSVHDIDYVFKTALMSDTRYSKAHRQTVYLGSNLTRKYFYNQGFILGNNANIDYSRGFDDKDDEDEEKFIGAMIGDPEHNSNYSKMIQNGEVLNLANNVDDFDAKSMYPSIDREFNLAHDNILGKVIIPDKVHKYENPYHDEKYDRGGQFMEDLITGNALEFSKRWLGLGTVSEVINDIIEYQNSNASFTPLLGIQCGYSGNIKPFAFLQENETFKPFVFYGDEDNNLAEYKRMD